MSSRTVFRWVTEALFPLHCISCGREGVISCVDCLEGVVIQGVWACPVCHKNTDHGEPCSGCRGMSVLAQAVALTTYEENDILPRLIQAYKYTYIDEAIQVFEPLLRDFYERSHSVFDGVDIIVPVPLHPARYAERGYNQAEVIAGMLSRIGNVPVVSALSRIRRTSQQARLSKRERKQNVQGAFVLADNVRVSTEGAIILLVDDVYTTGSTLGVCAETLMNLGKASSVRGFCLARGG